MNNSQKSPLKKEKFIHFDYSLEEREQRKPSLNHSPEFKQTRNSNFDRFEQPKDNS